MKVAVITPYHTEPLDMLKRAHDSVVAQTHACTHYMVADGHARAEIDNWPVRHIPLPTEHNNNGNTPRAIGSMDAIGDGFDAIAYLDADNWFEPEHIATLVALHAETGADLVSSGRIIHAIDGTVLLPDGETGDGERHADTSVLLFARAAFSVLPLWGVMPNELSPKCDHFVFKGALALGCTHRHNSKPTVHFTSRYGPHYRVTGRAIPPEATAMHAMKDSDQFARRLGAKGLSHILSGQDIANWFGKKLSVPYIFIVLTDKDDMTERERSVVTEIEEAPNLPCSIYFAEENELLSEKTLTDAHNNVFLVVFESRVKELTCVEAVAEQRGDIAIIYIRDQLPATNYEVDTTLDRRAWRIIVPSEDDEKRYLNECRYGNGHTMVADAGFIQNNLAPSIQSYAR